MSKSIRGKGYAHHLMGPDQADSLGLDAKLYCEHLNCYNRGLSRLHRRNLPASGQLKTAGCQIEKEPVDRTGLGVVGLSAIQS
ncbi:hypothetical protein KIN20_026297 [Parelaphostrongylus tenuis]|uniref:Uncharacterized protein n=1 Tax=Parelaphostrongylus tenuis TaxID=148309 RepID=A0AAD5QUZ8_PARTN|nr:hypothetical protein KIN20_026297 [Parelaphostrongylus tenuis]